MVGFLCLSSPRTRGRQEKEEDFKVHLDFDPIKEWLVDPDHPQMSMESSDPTKIDPDHPDPQEETHQEKELLSGSPIHEKMEKVTLVEEEDGGGGGGEKTSESDDFTGPEKEYPAKFGNGDSIDCDDDNDGEEESSEDSSSEESEESSSDESSSSSSSDDNKEEEEGKVDVVADLEEVEIEKEAMFMDSDEEVVVTKWLIKSKHELQVLPPVPPVDVSLEPHHKTVPVGVISSILGNRVIVEGSETHSPLNEGSILWITEIRSPLGIIDETFGPVKNPYYVIRFNSEEELPKGTNVGAAVSFTSEFAEHILNQDLYKKGYDASGDHDEEAEDDVEFSDDEKEAEYRRSLRQQKRGTNPVNHDSGFGRKTNFKGGAGFRKDKQSPLMCLPPLAAASCQQLGNQAGQVQAQATNITWTANPHPNVGPPPAMMMMQTQAQALQMGGGNPSQQLNAVRPHGFPPRLHSMGIQGGAFPMNSLPVQQFGQQSYAPQYQQQFQFNQALNMFASGLMPYLQQQQQQFLPNVGPSQPWFGGPSNLLAAPPSPVVSMGQGGFGGPSNLLAGPPSPVVTMGQGGFGLVPLGCSNEGPPVSFSEQRNGQAISQQGEVRPHLNRARPFFPGRRPDHRGRHSYGPGGRGQQKNG